MKVETYVDRKTIIICLLLAPFYRIGFFLIILMGLVLSILISRNYSIIGTILLYIIIINIFFGIYFLLKALPLLRNPKLQRGILGYHSFELREDHLVEKTEYNENKHTYSSITKVQKFLNILIIEIAGMSFYFLPLKSFPNKEEAEKFINDLRDKMQK